MNTFNFHVFRQTTVDEDEFQNVLHLAQSLHKYINLEETRTRIAEANVHGQPSQRVQACISEHAKYLGFQSEKTGLFS